MVNPSNILEVNDLCKNYKERKAVDNLTFHIKRGEIFGLLGPNGAGKTTTLSMLVGILKPLSGTIYLEGERFNGSPQSRSILGIAPQELAIYPKLTGRENLRFFGSLYRLSGAELDRRTEEILSLVGLSDRADNLTEEYSGGMKRRLNLAAGLMHNPKLLLLDEPTVGIDPQSRNHIFEGVRRLNKEGLSILYTSHYMEEVEALCHRVGIMDGGRLVACDTVPNLISTAGNAVVVVTLGEEASDAQIQELRSLPGVVDIECMRTDEPIGSSLLRVHALEPDRLLSSLVSRLNSSGLSLLSLTVQRPTLEDVFLSLTGKSLRD